MTQQTALWKMVENFIHFSKEHSVMVVQYENLKKNMRSELNKILSFLGVTPFTNILEQVNWLDGAHEITDIATQKFNAQQLRLVNSVIQTTTRILPANIRHSVNLYSHKIE